jgi:hypothetical protein
LASKCVASVDDVAVLGEAAQHVLDALLQGVHLGPEVTIIHLLARLHYSSLWQAG